MNIMELGAVGELVGGLAVIVSLTYVGLQLRQSNNLAKSTAEIELGRMYMDYARLGAEGKLSSIYARGVPDDTKVSEEERVRLVWALGMYTHMAQAMYRQAKRGLLSEADIEPLAFALVGGIEQTDMLRRVWDQNTFMWSSDFRAFIDRKRNEEPEVEWLASAGGPVALWDTAREPMPPVS